MAAHPAKVVAAVFAEAPNEAFSLGELCGMAWPELKHFAKPQRDAMKRAVKAHPGLRTMASVLPGAELIFFRDRCVEAHAYAWSMAHIPNYDKTRDREPHRSGRFDRLVMPLRVPYNNNDVPPGYSWLEVTLRMGSSIHRSHQLRARIPDALNRALLDLERLKRPPEELEYWEVPKYQLIDGKVRESEGYDGEADPLDFPIRTKRSWDFERQRSRRVDEPEDDHTLGLDGLPADEDPGENEAEG